MPEPFPLDALAMVRAFVSPTEESAWLDLLEVHARVTRALDRALIDGHQLPMSAFDLLMRIAHAPSEEVTISDLASQVAVSQSQVSRIVMDLERRGLVERRRNADDARSTCVAMTEQGFAFLHKAAPVYLQTLRKQFLDRLGSADAEQLAATWRRVLDDPAT